MKRLRLWMAAVLTLSALAVPVATAQNAVAEVNPPPGTDLNPVLGFTTWSALRFNVSAAKDEAQARALRSSGLEALGYRYVDQDEGWYACPGPQGPNVDHYGRWATNARLFPPGPGGENGIAVLAAYLHRLGMKFGIYVTPGISKQAVAKNTPILGTPYTARDIATTKPENNYHCGGMVRIDYTKPGARAFVNSIADEFARWGVDFVKLDGIVNANVPDIATWSDAIRQSGRPMQLDVTEGSYTTAIAGTLDKYATQWEYSTDIECYGCEKGGSSYPLTDYTNVKLRFRTLSLWYKYAGRQFSGYNDFDSVEVGNCTGDGLSIPARQTVLSLWALAASPLILGTDLTRLCPTDLRLLKDRAILAVDQDGISARPAGGNNKEQVVAKAVAPGTVVAGLFDTASTAETISATAATLGLPACSAGYGLVNLWTHKNTRSGATIRATVPARGVVLLRITSRCASHLR